ncbi:MAG: putative DNA binding domain-containing protein [Planctomycetes bacterium]|nr:putative DNA binding domain-containing protein [Planctomycetota bacterium]
MGVTVSEIRVLLRQLDGSPADAIESESLECKPWDPDPRRLKEQLREIRETVVSLANARGGVIVLGIQDRMRSRAEAITGVGDLSPDVLRKRIYDGTDPHVLVDCEEILEPEGRLLALHVPQGLGVHTTSEGVAKVRVGKDCQPLTGSMLALRFSAGTDFDRTAQLLAGSTAADVDSVAVQQLQRLLATEGRKPELARLGSADLLEGLGLQRDGELTFAAVLLAGRATALARWAPQHEVVFLRYTSRARYDLRHNLKGPIVSLLETLRGLLDLHLGVATIRTDGFQEMTLPDLTWWTAREAVLNALVHRDYFLRQSVYVELRPARVEVTSPGGFVGGVSPENVLRHPPVRRNPLLADVLEAAGLVNRAGMGVDRMYEELLRAGKGPPRFEADEASVRLMLQTRSHGAFARFVAEQARQERSLDLDDLILLRAATDRGRLDRWAAAEHLQAAQAEAAERLAALRERGYLAPRGRGRGTSYLLARAYADRLRGTLAMDESVLVDEQAVRQRIQEILGQGGQLTNAEVRRMAGYSRDEVLRLMRALRADGLVKVEGRGRAAHYVAGPRCPRARVRRKSAPARRRKGT